MSEIKYDESKPKFDILQWKDVFEHKGFEVPENEVEFVNTFLNKNMSIQYIKDEIKNKLNCDDDDLEEECRDKKSKINKFLEIFDIVYPSEKNKNEEDEEPESENKTPKDGTEEDTEKNDNSIYCNDIEQISIEDAQELWGKYKQNRKEDFDSKIKFKAPTLYKDMSVTVNSNFSINCTIDNISENNILIVDSSFENVVAVGKIISKEGKKLIVINKLDIEFSEFENKTQFNLAVLKINNQSEFTGEIFYKPIIIKMTVMEKTDRVLCIDFGTSNTTAGSYRVLDEFGTEPELVNFVDITHENMLVNYFPTVVYVENCENPDNNPDNIKYRFGFEAKLLEKEGNYSSSASVFYQIKQWLIEDSFCDDKIEIFDKFGNMTKILKTDIVRAYIKHVISLSEDYFNVKFNELHFTAPVKMKEKFISILARIMPEYKIVSDGIDEAGAILFDYVTDKFVKWERSREESLNEGNVAVIDCGGGTCDLASCEYHFYGEDEVNHITKIEIDTKFTNGDFNFGGNNITYRIMQLIKIKIAINNGFISKEELEKIFERSENDILIDADDINYDGEALYNEYNNLYLKCENFLPTKFNNEAEIYYDDDVPKIKRNFYYLWQFAEQVKITFYREEKEVKKDKWDEAIQTIGDIKLNYLYKYENDNFIKLESPLDNLEVTITEIRKAIFGDIYNLLNKILPLENGLTYPVYDYYKLSGQSCKINLFNELLKEFIPGKRLRAKMERNREQIESISLKKHCIDGSIRYMMYKRLNMRTELVSKYEPAEKIYSVYFADLIGELVAEEKSSADETKNVLIFYPIKSELEEVTVIVKDLNKVIRKINISTKEMKESGRSDKADDIIKTLKNGNDKIDWDETCRRLADYNFEGKDDSIYFLVAVPAGNVEGYGFYTYFIKKIIKNASVGETGNEIYILSEGKYFNYEETNNGFFDGSR